MSKEQRFVRLQISGGTGFNFILPADPNWKVSQLEDHMVSLYNQIASSQSSSVKATKIRSLKRNGFFVASSLKVGAVFNDWDEVTCIVVTKVGKEDQEDQHQKKKSSSTKTNEKKKNPERKQSQQIQQKKVKNNTKKSQKSQEAQKNEHAQKKQKNSSNHASLSADKLLSMMQIVRQNKKQASQNASQNDKSQSKKTENNQKKPKEKETKKSRAIIIQQESD